ncbi:MAG: heme A synthase [Polyangiales bacterium]
MTGKQARYKQASLAMIAYTLFVILWGALVRATLSGAGCGDHWPLCNGEVVPLDPSLETLIELTHRITSGLAWIFALLFVLFSRRVYEKGHLARRGASWTLFFMTTEALVGAGLVLTKMVADNPESTRAYWAAAHLLNTFALLYALTMHAHYANGGKAITLPRGERTFVRAVYVVLLIVGATGAIAALGDTLFPATSVGEALAADFDSSSHIFLRLRALHPIAALVGAGLCVTLGVRAYNQDVGAPALWLMGVACTQVGLGFLNILLLAPVWLQLVHLALADTLWISVTWLALRLSAQHASTKLDAVEAEPARA